MKAIEEILRKTKYDGETGVISVYVSKERVKSV